MSDLFIIPQSEESIIAKIENDTISEIRQIDISWNSKNVVTENKLIVSLCFETSTLYIYDILGNLLFKKNGMNYKAINYKNNIVYLGGEHNERKMSYSIDGDMFSIINLEESNIKAHSKHVPIKRVDGKSIDDILIHGNDLILVDNIMYPKYLIEYDISSPESPKHTDTITLPNNGTYEHIIKGDINNDWLILYSSTIGMGGFSSHITISGKTEGYLSISKSFTDNLDKEKSNSNIETVNYLDIAIFDNYLYILRTDGLGYIDLNKTISNDKFKLVKTNISNIERLIKSPCGNLIAINKNDYELIKKNSN